VRRTARHGEPGFDRREAVVLQGRAGAPSAGLTDVASDEPGKCRHTARLPRGLPAVLAARGYPAVGSDHRPVPEHPHGATRWRAGRALRRRRLRRPVHAGCKGSDHQAGDCRRCPPLRANGDVGFRCHPAGCFATRGPRRRRPTRAWCADAGESPILAAPHCRHFKGNCRRAESRRRLPRRPTSISSQGVFVSKCFSSSVASIRAAVPGA
jgi:hypothetical protein